MKKVLLAVSLGMIALASPTGALARGHAVVEGPRRNGPAPLNEVPGDGRVRVAARSGPAAPEVGGGGRAHIEAPSEPLERGARTPRLGPAAGAAGAEGRELRDRRVVSNESTLAALSRC